MTTKSQDPFSWLARECGLDDIGAVDLSRGARRAFVEDHGDKLFAFWSDAFTIERHKLSERLISKVVPQDTDDIGVAIANKLLDRLENAPVLESVPKWTDLDGCVRWLAGSQAASAARGEESATRALSAEVAGRVAESPDAALAEKEFRERCRNTIDRWVTIWETIINATHRPEFELNWLVATSVARRPLNQILADRHERPSDAIELDRPAYFEVSKAALLDELEIADRGTSSRLRAAACLRFDIEYFYRVESKERIWSTREVFIGPTVDKPPHKPKQAVGHDDVEGALLVLEWAARRPRNREDALDTIETAILQCALMKTVDRMFACKHRPLVKRRVEEFEAMRVGRRKTND